jgi:hypothetical protein
VPTLASASALSSLVSASPMPYLAQGGKAHALRLNVIRDGREDSASMPMMSDSLYPPASSPVQGATDDSDPEILAAQRRVTRVPHGSPRTEPADARREGRGPTTSTQRCEGQAGSLRATARTSPPGRRRYHFRHGPQSEPDRKSRRQ